MGGSPKKKQTKRKKREQRRRTRAQKERRARKVSRRKEQERDELLKKQKIEAHNLVCMLSENPDSDQAQIFAQGKRRGLKGIPSGRVRTDSYGAFPPPKSALAEYEFAHEMLEKHRKGFLDGDPEATFLYGYHYNTANIIPNMVKELSAAVMESAAYQAQQHLLSM